MTDMQDDDTSGFYRVDPNGDFQHAPNFVFAPDYAIRREDRASYTYPTPGGWVWSESRAEARTHFGLPPEQIEQPDELPNA